MTTVDKIEIEKFSKLAKQSWDPHGKFKPLHLFNPARIKFIKEKLNFKNEFDVLLSMEVIEHTKNVNLFIQSCSKLIKRNGIMFIATINKNLKFLLFLFSVFVMMYDLYL